MASLAWNLKPETDIGIHEAVYTAKKSDIAIFVTCIVEGKGEDRPNLTLPVSQGDLIQAVSSAGVPTAVILINRSTI